MEYKIRTNVKLDYIQDFEMMFERMKLHRPREAAVYYVILVVDSPKEFSDFLKIAEDLSNITRRPLETGRACLFKNGLIAKVLFSNANTSTFGRESYLPVHPQAIWENIKDDLKQYVAPETYSSMEHHLNIYSDYYQQNFERYGIKLKRSGNVTLEYNGKWIMYNVLHNSLQKGNNLKFQVSGNRFFKEPFINYFKKFLELDTKIQVLVDSEVDKELIKKFKEIYGDKLELRAFPDGTSGTLRNYVFGKEFAINGIKILKEKEDEPSYIGTAYVDLEDVEELNNKFESLWNLAKPLI